ncbi:MAG: hypothetical protein HQL46_09225 [Gammaproteobacteria bacterium]|nr:hypothetical protein [Gammaproteobacteria bacterium]
MIIFRQIVHQIKQDKLSFSEDDLKRSIIRALMYLIIIIVLHVVLMVLFEHFHWTDGLWLTLTTLSTTGYGDISASTLPGKAATIVLLYIGGIFLAAKIAGDYFEYRASIRTKKMNGTWEWGMKDHLLIINTPNQHGETFFMKFIEQLRSSGIDDCNIEILTEKFPQGLPSKLSKMSGLAHYTGSALIQEDLAAVGPEQAKYIVILAKDEQDINSDSRTFDILYRLKQMDVMQPLILAECVDDKNREKFKEMGADIVLRPIRAYPEMLVRGLAAPGSEQIIENLFSAEGEHYLRYDIQLSGLQWKNIVIKLLEKDFGLAIAYIDINTGALITNPLAHEEIAASALILMSNDNHTIAGIQDILNALQ